MHVITQHTSGLSLFINSRQEGKIEIQNVQLDIKPRDLRQQ